MERWERVSLCASPCTTSSMNPRQPAWRGKDSRDSMAFSTCEPESLLLDGCELHGKQTYREVEPAIFRHAGWLLKAHGTAAGPHRQWASRFVYLTEDRLCYTPDPEAESVRYIPLDRIPVRALPRGYGPKLGVAAVEDRQVGGMGNQRCCSRLGVGWRKR